MYNICQNTVILVIFILCWRERDLPNIIKLKAKERRIPERRIHQNILGILHWYNVSQGVQNSISVPKERCGFGGQNIMPTHNLGHVYFLPKSDMPEVKRALTHRLSRVFGAGKLTNHKCCEVQQVVMQMIKLKVCCKKQNSGLLCATCCHNLQHRNLLRDKLRARVVIRATTLFNLQRNNVARQVARIT